MKFGEFELFLIDDGKFRLDGGAMYGVVPKTIWKNSKQPDDKNRIQLSANCLLVKTPDANILVDTGLGGKWNEKHAKIFAVEQPRQLISELARCDVSKDEISHVILSHLHFDHTGGSTFIDKNGDLQAQFPNAKYYVQRGEWEIACDPNPRDKLSYLKENFIPLEEAGLLELVDGDAEIVPGVKMRVTGGHTENHSIIYVQSGGFTAVFNADIIPTASHLHVPFVMGYDLYPQGSMDFKTEFSKEAYEGKYLMVFEHGLLLKAGHLTMNSQGKLAVKKFDMEVPDYSQEINK